ncbi:MAG TPA: NCS2 family permease, partial [Candidatus Hydrogenedentes bacterium]|nr:NCS2 family permease [Candidatus Hydrogenedentota bacterium]HOJ67785.1 NCS2 family permease [Candidatus Hydrogenedentota bacterium]HOK89071.1 NCS2 family permease [Candidatus Hydrogenedentota bacterium]
MGALWQRLDTFFEISARGSTVGREIGGGISAFAAMSYIVFVQPTVLTMAGMDFGAVLMATCVSSAIACGLMGILARYPFALAPGMGENFLFALTICVGMGYTWQNALGMVLISGVLFVILTLTGARERVLEVFPTSLRNAIGPAIGLFIAFIGLQWSGLVALSPATMVRLGDLRHPVTLVALAGLGITVTLMLWRVRAALLVGVLATAGIGWLTGAFQAADAPASSVNFGSFFQVRFDQILERPANALTAIALLFFLDFFDTVGSLVGLSTQAGFIDERGRLPRAGRAFLSDALGTCVGALCGTSTVTTYVESAAGISAGARTGLAAIVTGACFLLAPLLMPVAAFVGGNVGPAYYASLGMPDALVAMHPAVSPALVLVGFLMLAPLSRIDWKDLTEGLPAFVTVLGMVFGYGITEGIALGCIACSACKVLAGRAREIHPVFHVIALLFVLRYAFLA